MPYGSSDFAQELMAKRCIGEWVGCKNCGQNFLFCSRVSYTCPKCGGKDFKQVPWWYGRVIPPEISGKVLEDGRKVVPKFYVEVRAYLHPVNGGDPFLTWLEAEKWFKEQGWEVMDDKE